MIGLADDAVDVLIVEINFLRLWMDRSDLSHVPCVVWLQNGWGADDCEGLHKDKSNRQGTLIGDRLRLKEFRAMINVVAKILEPQVWTALHVEDVELPSLAKAWGENRLIPSHRLLDNTAGF